MNNVQMRAYISNLYSNRKWRRRVERMPDHQVAAIYFDHVQRGRLPEQIQKETQEHLEIPPGHPHENEDQFPIV